MKLSKLKLKNYRCFGSEEQVILIDQLTTFIGNNSTGKTAALSAINCMFSENSNDRILHRSDFHLPQNILPDEMEQQSLYIEAIFEFEELQSGSNGGEYAIPIFFQHFVVDNPGGLPYLRIRLEATWEKSNTIDGSIDSKISYITCPEFAEIEEGNRTNASRRDLDKIRVIYVPAVRDPSKQLKNASGTMMYQIMSSINWSEETKGRVKTKIKELNEQFEGEKGVSMFGTSLGKQWKTYDSDERYSTASLRFNSTDIETSIRKTEVVFEPTETGKEYTIDQMGDGLRSLFYISLVDSILDVEGQMVREIETDPEHTSFNRKPPILTIVALEEPENHIAPHLLGKLVGNLKDIAEKNNAQAIMTSHSPSIVKRIDPENLRYFRLDRELLASKVRCITLPDEERMQDQYKYIKEAVRAYPELYFAKLVILGEGDSEEIILPKYWEAIHGNTDVSGISIVPLGGRHVNHFWRLLNDLEIPYITLVALQKAMYESLKEKATEVCASGNWAEDDGNIALFIADNEQLEAAAVSKDILLKISNGVEPHDICILCKQKPQDYASAVIEELEKHGVRARIETGYQDLIKEPIVDLFIKFMICADSRKHPNEWTFIEELLVELWGISGMRENDTFDEMQRKLSAVVNVVKKNIQQKLDTEQWHSTLNSIIDFFGIGNIKAKFPAYKQGTYFMNVINQFESLFFEEYVAAHGVWNLAIENFRGDHSVPIMTIHKSKGLEYNAVYFIGLEDSAFWNFRNQPDEDRCTFFVALSRAKASVTFTFCKKRSGMKCPMQRHNAINEFFDLLQRPGIAEVKRFQNR